MDNVGWDCKDLCWGRLLKVGVIEFVREILGLHQEHALFH